MNYYNEHDPKAAEWLRQLIAASLIPFGHVDTRSITDVHHHDLAPYRQCHFFAGIGGWPRALALAGVCHTREIWTASCPCQPFSTAGKGKGTEDERHLWPVFAKLVQARRPSAIFGEQVASKAGRQWFAGIRADLEGLGYEVGGADLCAASVGAPHIRQRLYWCAASRLGQPDRPGWDQGEPTSAAARHGGAAEPASDAGRLADTPGMRRSEQREEPGEGSRRGTGAHDTPERARPGGVADAGRGMHERGGRPSEAHGTGGEAEGHGSERQRGGAAPGDCLPVCRLGIPPGEGLQEREGAGTAHAQFTPIVRAGAWDDFDLLECTDGKARRTQPGIFPLADGVSGRVGLLRGYGNAIVPPLAAVFIEEALNVIDHD